MKDSKELNKLQAHIHTSKKIVYQAMLNTYFQIEKAMEQEHLIKQPDLLEKNGRVY